jgi:hypothetical protein
VAVQSDTEYPINLTTGVEHVRDDLFSPKMRLLSMANPLPLNCQPTSDYLNDHDLVAVGEPDECVRKLKSYQAAGADHILIMQQVGTIPPPESAGVDRALC